MSPGSHTWIVLMGTVLLTSGAALIGTMNYVRKRALIGDVISHALLPGVVLSYMVSESKTLWVLLPGAFIAGWCALQVQHWLKRFARMQEDAIQATLLTVFFGFGLVLLSYVQQSGSGTQAGLDKFLFGNAAALLQEDLYALGLVAATLVVCLVLFFRPLLVYCFDPAFAAATGLPVRLLEHLLSALTVAAVVLGMQAVGVVLMAALLISPAAAARYWTDRMVPMLLLAVVFGVLSSLGGVWISASFISMPTGPWMVVCMSIFALGSALVAPGKGILAEHLRKKRQATRIAEENILKALVHARTLSLKTIHLNTGIQETPLTIALNRLIRRGLVEKTGTSDMTLTVPGMQAANRIVRLHRLWELYLSHRMSIASDHVHADAEHIEHLLTPELEHQLEQELGFPTHDPHNREIPRPT